MKEEQIRLSFLRVKQDIENLRNEILTIKNEVGDIKEMLNSLSAIQQINSTNLANPTHNPTVPQEIRGLKTQNLSISTGNEGVPTDKQTDSPTDILPNKNNNFSIESNIQKASDILDSLDHIKKQIRLKFKKITSQEMAVFSMIYQLEEQNPEIVTYKQVASILKLSESSIRDYVQKIINKGIPIKKQKFNNKKVILYISPDLKKIVTLSTILKLREL